MKRLLLYIVGLLFVCACGREVRKDSFFLWTPTDADFDSVTRRIESAYCEDLNYDTILSLTNQLSMLAARDSTSRLKSGRSHFFKARYRDLMRSYATRGDTTARKEIALAYRAYGDTTSYPYEIFRLRFIDNRNRPISLEQLYYHHQAMLQQSRLFGDSLNAGGSLNNIGRILMELGDTAFAVSHFKEAERIFEELHATGWLNKLRMADAVASKRRLPQRHDSLMRVLVEYADRSSDTLYREIIYRNMYIDYQDSIYLKKSYALIDHPGANIDLRAYLSAAMANHYFNNHNLLDSAIILATQAHSLTRSSLAPQYQMEVLKAYEKAMRATGNIAAALEASLRYGELADSLQKERSGYEIYRNMSSRRFAEIRATSAQKQRQDRIVFFIVLLCLVLVALVAMFIIYLRFNKTKNEKIRAELELANNQLQLASSRLVLQESNNTIDQALEIIRKMIADGIISPKEGADINFHLKSQIANRDELATFQDVYEKLNPNFPHALKAQFPGVTESMIKLAMYICMGLDNHQIARIKNVSYQSVIIARSRLRKKLGLSKEVVLEDFLRQYARY